MESPKDNKEAIRRRLLSQRQQLSPSQVHSWSQQIFSNLTYSPLFPVLKGARAVGIYAPMKGEVDTGGVSHVLRSAGCATAYPKVIGDGLRFYEVLSPEELAPGTWGILEPESKRPVSLERIEFLIVPGVAFDERGYRIGFGKGYYDRVLEVFSGTAIGFAYEFQMVSSVPHEPLDRPCHWVVTEKRLIEGKRG